MYWHLSQLQSKAHQPAPMLKAMWAPSIHRWVSVILASSTACVPDPGFPPAQFGIPHSLSPVYHPVSHWNLIFFSTGRDQGWEESQPGSQRSLWGLEQSFGSCLPELPSAQWGSSIAPLQGTVRGHTALWDFQTLRGWGCTMTRARHLFVTSPRQVLTSKTCLAGNNNSFTEPMVLGTPAHHLFFQPLAF